MEVVLVCGFDPHAVPSYTVHYVRQTAPDTIHYAVSQYDGHSPTDGHFGHVFRWHPKAAFGASFTPLSRIFDGCLSIFSYHYTSERLWKLLGIYQ